jgi:hypothetical protein
MMIKLLLILGIAGAAVIAVRGSNSSAHLAVRRLLSALFVLVAAASVIFPDAVTWLANRVGVTTGANLVLYGLVVVFLFVTIGLYQRIHVLESKLVSLSREIALTAHASESTHDNAPARPHPSS